MASKFIHSKRWNVSFDKWEKEKTREMVNRILDKVIDASIESSFRDKMNKKGVVIDAQPKVGRGD